MIGESFEEKWRFRSREVTVIKNLLHSNSDFFIYGLPGIGKSAIVHDCLRNERLLHIKINCIESSEKSSLLKDIYKGISRIFSIKQKEPRTFSRFIESLAEVVQELKQNQKFNWEDKSVHIVLDNCEKLNLSTKNYSSLLRIRRALKINFNIVFVGSTMLEEITIGNYEFSTIPKICLPNPSPELLSFIFWRFMINEILILNQ